MLKRINLIQGVGNFSQTRAGGIELSAVNVIYGENRYGKSTLCDILHSLAEDAPDYILNRESIPNDPTRPTEVELTFSTNTGNIVSKFEASQWQVKTPDCSKLYVFDQSFIHRNVITGQKQERPNSESMTSFILGESNTALFAELEGIKLSLREERRLFSEIESHFNRLGIANIPTYVNSDLPTRTKLAIEAAVAEHANTIQQVNTTIRNIGSIKNRNNLVTVSHQLNFDGVYELMNTVLASSMQNVHQESLATLQSHMTNHVNNPTIFKGWASQGIPHIEDNCPFCGQVFSPDARNLITAYQQAFNEDFERFNNQTRNTLNNLRQPFSIPNSRESLNQQHQSNKQIIEPYIEPQISINPEIATLVTSLDEKHRNILTTFDAVTENIQHATAFWTPILEQKYLAPYEAIEPISFDVLDDLVIAYNTAIYDYFSVTESINAILNQYKDSLDVVELNSQLGTLTNITSIAQQELQRIELDPLCAQYRQALAIINGLNTTYSSQKITLEQSQTAYLDTYFNLINTLFRELGSNNFELMKSPNNRGSKIIYDLKVKFKTVEIPPDRINTVFSESDRRALALCVFLAKVMSLTNEEREKAILVLDDPVTSFDNERIELILVKFDELQRTVKQIIVTTHYKGMASKTAKKFKHCAKALKLVHGNGICSIQDVGIAHMIASDHDIAFDKIKAFVDRETHLDIRTNLRPFLENEIRFRYKRALVDLGKTSLSDLSPCIEELKNNGNISKDVAARISSITGSLNTPMHEISDESLENTRSLAEKIMNVVYNDL